MSKRNKKKDKAPKLPTEVSIRRAENGFVVEVAADGGDYRYKQYLNVDLADAMDRAEELLRGFNPS